jgi:hypothetical protein
MSHEVFFIAHNSFLISLRAKIARFGAHSAGETPVLIPNTEAKPSSGDNTLYGEGSTAPNYRIKRPNRSLFLLAINLAFAVPFNLMKENIVIFQTVNHFQQSRHLPLNIYRGFYAKAWVHQGVLDLYCSILTMSCAYLQEGVNLNISSKN